MSAVPRGPRTRPRHPSHLAILGADDTAEVIVSITVRGAEAISAIAPLVAAVREIGSAAVTVAAAPGRGADDEMTAGFDYLDDEAGAEHAPLRILTQEYVAELDGTPLELPRREYDLLLFLATHPRHVFTRGQLLQTVWGYEFGGGGRTVDVHVRRLRQKLGDRGPSIATVRGVGYRLDETDRVVVVDPALPPGPVATASHV